MLVLQVKPLQAFSGQACMFSAILGTHKSLLDLCLNNLGAISTFLGLTELKTHLKSQEWAFCFSS